MAEGTVRVLVHSESIGGLIGKNGEFVNAVRAESGARIQIIDHTVRVSNGENDRIVALSGSPFQILTALTRIIPCLQLLIFKLLIDDSQVGGLIGKNGLVINDIRDQTGVAVSIHPLLLHSSDKLVVIAGHNLMQIYNAFTLIVPILLKCPPRPQHTLHFGPPGAYPLVGTRPDLFQEKSIRVPIEVIGALIGKSGNVINNIRTVSLAQIKISDTVPGQSERMIVITGSPQAVEIASGMLTSRINREMKKLTQLAASKAAGGRHGHGHGHRLPGPAAGAAAGPAGPAGPAGAGAADAAADAQPGSSQAAPAQQSGSSQSTTLTLSPTASLHTSGSVSTDLSSAAAKSGDQ